MILRRLAAFLALSISLGLALPAPAQNIVNYIDAGKRVDVSPEHPLPTTSSGGGGGGGAVTAVSGAYAAGAITDLGTGANPAANTTNNYLKAIQAAIGQSFSFELAPTITVQNAPYAAGNALGGKITVTGAARSNGGSGTLAQLQLTSAGGSTNSVWVYAFSKNPASTCTDKTAFSFSATDKPVLLAGFPVQVTLGGSPGAFDAHTYAAALALNAVFKNTDTSAGTAIYLCLVTAGSVTPAATTDLSIVLGGYQD